MIIQNLTTYFLQPIPQCPQTAPLRDDLHRERPRRGRVRTEEFDTRSPRVGATSDTFWAGFEMLLLPEGLSATGSPAQAFQLQFRIGKTAAQIMQGHTAQLCAQQWCCERCFFRRDRRRRGGNTHEFGVPRCYGTKLQHSLVCLVEGMGTMFLILMKQS